MMHLAIIREMKNYGPFALTRSATAASTSAIFIGAQMAYLDIFF